ncbi:hypothetical protein ACB092_04G100400 [Castanea dentata]
MKSDRILILCFKVIPIGGGTTSKGEKGHFGSFCILKFVEKGNLQRRSRNIWLCLADHNQIKPQSISLGIIFLKDAYLQWHILCFSIISYTFYSKYGSDLSSPKTPECFIRNFISIESTIMSTQVPIIFCLLSFL